MSSSWTLGVSDEICQAHLKGSFEFLEEFFETLWSKDNLTPEEPAPGCEGASDVLAVIFVVRLTGRACVIGSFQD